jgi:hypothetical protein
MRKTNFLWVVLVSLCAAVSLLAQGNTGAILGTIADSSGAVVPAAKVVVSNLDTGEAFPTTTDGVGNYSVRFLQPDHYKVEAEAAGFRKAIRTDIALDLAREFRVDFVLEAGGVTEAITVTGGADLVETETGTISSTMESTQVTSLPLFDRDAQKLALLIPGVMESNTTASGAAGGYSRLINGGLIGRDAFFVDGANIVNHVYGTNPYNPNPDTLAEFKVLTNSFSAEYGDTGGGVMVAVTKSGSNEFHGDGYEFFQNNVLNAGNFFTHQVPIIRHNLFGGTIGGPIRKDKTFFFWDLQDLRELGTSIFTNYTVPLPAFRQGNFSSLLGAAAGTDVLGSPVAKYEIYDPLTQQTVKNSAGQNVVVRTPFANNTIPAARFSRAAQLIQALYPAPTFNTAFANYDSSGETQNFQAYMDAKVDHYFSPNDRLMVRYSQRWYSWLDAQPFPGNGGGGSGGVPGHGYLPGHSAVANYVHVFGARATTFVNVNWWDHHVHRFDVGYGQISQNDLGIYGLPSGSIKWGPPVFNFTNYNNLGDSAVFTEYDTRRSISNMTTLSRNRQTIKFGGEVTLLRTDNDQPNTNTSWSFSSLFSNQQGFGTTGFDYASFLLGIPASLSYQIDPDTLRVRTTEYGLFVQDDIRVSRKLTVNVGLRWDIPQWFHERLNRSGLFNINLNQFEQFGTAQLPRNTLYQQNYAGFGNFGPRLGFAYTPWTNGKTVVRGGYGVFAVGVGRQPYGFLGIPTTPFYAQTDGGRYNTTDQVTWRTTLDQVPYTPQSLSGSAYTSVSIAPNTQAMGYIQQYNLTVSHEFKDVLVGAGFVGSVGRHLPIGAYNMNAIPMTQEATARGQYIAPYVPYPAFPNGVTFQDWIGKSSFNSLQLTAEKRFGHGLAFQGAYAFQRWIDSQVGNYRDPAENRNLDRGLDPNGVPQRLAVAWIYDFPFGKGRNWFSKGPLEPVIGGWQTNIAATFQSGFPLTPVTSYNSAVNTGQSRPNVVGNPDLSGSQRTLLQYYNVSAFALPALYTTGNAGTGMIYGPGRQSVNLNLAKHFYNFGKETRNLEFRFEFYNIFNTPNFAAPNMTVDSATAGRITSATNSRTMQLALKFYF